jgi:hypothetical protein
MKFLKRFESRSVVTGVGVFKLAGINGVILLVEVSIRCPIEHACVTWTSGQTHWRSLCAQ